MKKTLYSGITHQQDFTSKLSKILNNPESSIAVAFMASFVNGGAALFLFTEEQVKKGIDLSLKSSSFVFNFSKSFSENKETKAIIESSAISAQDFKNLSNLFDEYTFENPAEGNFFASKFFYPDNGKIHDSIVYLHFKALDNLNTFVIDDKNLYKSYGIIKKEDLVSKVVTSGASTGLTELDLSRVVRNSNKEFVLEQLKKRDSSDVACEVFFDLATGKFYAGKILQSLDEVSV